MLSTLSPGGKIQWVTPGKPYLGVQSNPFIEKSDIVNHKEKIQKIDQNRDLIQTIYKEHKTWAQFEEEKKNVRDKYFDTKMHEQWSRIDHDKMSSIQKRKDRMNETCLINK
jgi:hypothetical protein